MAEERIFFLKAEEFCNRPLYTCAPGDMVADVARRMSEHNISSIVVCEGGRPVGMITDRDFRNKVVPDALNPLRMPASAAMSSPLVTVREDDYLFEALYQMSRHDIHRVAVVDGEGSLAGIITDTDLLRLQTSSPLYLIRDIEYAQDLETIKVIYGRVVQLIIGLSRSGIKTADLVRLISHIHDAVVLRLIHVIRQGEFEDLTDRFAFVVLGSEGRMEQTLKTDQDNAIVYADDLGEAEVEKLTRFSERLIDSLIAIGVPPCPGGIMAKNEYWRQKASVWEKRISEWTGSPTPDNILKFSMFSEIRLLYGDEELVARIRKFTQRHVRENAVFIAHMAKNILRFPPPLGWWGRIKVARTGEHRGMLDIKKSGIFAFTEGMKLLALNDGVDGAGTWDRIRLLGEIGELAADEVVEYTTNFNFLVYVRLQSQVQALEAGRTATDWVDPRALNVVEQERLRIAFQAVRSFQNLLKLRFKLDFISS